jgi:hypothetical protein
MGRRIRNVSIASGAAIGVALAAVVMTGAVSADAAARASRTGPQTR